MAWSLDLSGRRPGRWFFPITPTFHPPAARPPPSMLHLVATPIGNLGDIALRALEVLKSADLIAAEDTRHSGILLKHFGIKKPFISYHEHNEARRAPELVERRTHGENVALITDAGTPGLSDPGLRLIRECIQRELPFTIIPGPSSILTALLGSGFS